MLRLHSLGKLPKDLMMTPLKVFEFLNYDEDEEIAAKLSQDKYYASHLLEIYAIEDDYDQVLCRRLGYDILVLANMTGCYKNTRYKGYTN